MRCRDAAHFVGHLAVAVMMDADQRRDPSLHRIGQVVVRGVLVGEQRMAAGFRHFDRIQHVARAGTCKYE
jgi:hypothetical protein